MWPKSEFFHHLGRNLNENSYFCIKLIDGNVMISY
jgi:hypothetical protein